MGLRTMKKNKGNSKTALKVLTYGESNTGKTYFALSFPKIATIDTEDGQAHYRDKFDIQYILTTTSAVEAEEALEDIKSEYESIKDEVKTVVVDSETKLYENLQHSALALVEKKARRKGQLVEDANLSQREWGKIKQISKRIKNLQIDLAKLGINVVSVCQEKAIKERVGDEIITTGFMPNANTGIEHDFDIVIRQYKTVNQGTGEVKYMAKVEKDRTGTFTVGAEIENPSFEHWVQAYKDGINAVEEEATYSDSIDKDEDELSARSFDELKDELSIIFGKISMKQKKEIKALCDTNKVDLEDEKTIKGLKIVMIEARKMIDEVE